MPKEVPSVIFQCTVCEESFTDWESCYYHEEECQHKEDFTMAFPLKTSALSRGVYVIDRYNDGVFFTKEEYAPRTVHNTTYQLPMPEYGV